MAGLTALNPFFLTLLPLAGVPVIFHLFFRLKKQARPFPTLMFFARLDPKLNARRRLRQWLVLLLRTLLIALVLLVLARPVWFGVGRQGSVALCLVLDNSGSMSGAGDGGQTKLKHALNAARSLILQLRSQDSAGLVPVVDDPAAPLPAGLTPDKPALRNALDGLVETEAGGSAARAIERAVAMLEGSAASHFELHVLTDLQEEKWGQTPVDLRAPRRGTRIVVHRIPSPRANRPNVSLAGVQTAARTMRAGRRLPLEARLINPTGVEGRIRLNWQDDAGRHGSQELALPPQADQSATLALQAQDPGLRWVDVWIEGDEFTADNRAPVAFWCPEKRPVLFVGTQPEFGLLPLAMSPVGEGALSGLMPSFIEASALAGSLRSGPPGFAALTWETMSGAGAGLRWAALRQFLDAGGSVLLVPASASASLAGRPDWVGISAEPAQNAPGGWALAVLAKAHPMFNDLRDEKGEVALRNVKVFKFCPLRGAATNTPVLGLEDGRAVLVEQALGRGRLLVCGLAFDPAWSTLPLKPGFVALAQGMALAQSASATNVLSLVAGEPLRSPGSASIRVQSLVGSPFDWKGGPAQLTTLPRSGVYAIHNGSQTTYAAVRAADKEGRQKFLAGERVPALGKLPYSVRDFAGPESLVSDFRKLERSLDLGPLLLALAFFCLIAEGILANPLPLRARRGPRFVPAASRASPASPTGQTSPTGRTSVFGGSLLASVGTVQWHPRLGGIWCSLILMAAAAWIWVVYRRLEQRLGPPKARWLIAPKAGALLLLSLVLLDPVSAIHKPQPVRGKLLALVDCSSSMDVADDYHQPRKARARAIIEQWQKALPEGVQLDRARVRYLDSQAGCLPGRRSARDRPGRLPARPG